MHFKLHRHFYQMHLRIRIRTLNYELMHWHQHQFYVIHLLILRLAEIRKRYGATFNSNSKIKFKMNHRLLNIKIKYNRHTLCMR